MSTKGYTLLGWIVWQIGSRVAKKKIAQNRVKIGAAAVVVLVLLGGVAAAKAGDSDSP
jgi:sulfite exporter TauE/SafE